MTKTIKDINLMEWFSKRKLDYIPVHFLKSSIPLNSADAVTWIEERTAGRYAIKRDFYSLTLNYGIPYFEDPKELMLYELTFG